MTQAALSARISRLEREEILVRSAATDDRRASMLHLTSKGMRTVESIHLSIERDSQFVRQLYRLPEEDRAALARIMGELHTELDREFARSS